MSSKGAGSEARKGGARFTAFLALVCVLLGIEVVVLALENRRLKEAHAAAPAEPVEQTFVRQRFARGDPFGAFALRSPDGRVIPVVFDGAAERTLVLVVAPGCNACSLVAPTWNEVVEASASPALRVLAIQLDQSAPITPDEGLAVPLYHFADPTRLPLAKLTSVPITIVLDAAGFVEWVAYGDLGEARRAELLALLGERSD